MSTLVAGVGNLFFGDDGFGVEVARYLSREPPPGAAVADFGIRALHLAYELAGACSLCIVADCVARGGAPGTLYVIDPDLGEAAGTVADAHSMNLGVAFAAARELGGALPTVVVVGCEPVSVEPGIGLSDPVARAVPAAAALIRELVSRRTQEEPS